MPRAPRRFPKNYGDPVYKLIKSLPFLSYERRDALALCWQSVGPTRKVHRATMWYQRHDRSIIVLLKLFVAVLPLILTRIGVTVEWIIPTVIAGLYVAEWLAREREKLQRAKRVEEAFEAHWDMLREEQSTNPKV